MSGDAILAVMVILTILAFIGFMRVIFYLVKAMNTITLRLFSRWS